MRSNPWQTSLRRDGYSVVSDDIQIVTINRALPRDQQRELARLISSLPDLLTLLCDAEDYFGDLPSHDYQVRELHGRMLEVLNAAKIPLHSAV